jgi:hypothetical protein
VSSRKKIHLRGRRSTPRFNFIFQVSKLNCLEFPISYLIMNFVFEDFINLYKLNNRDNVIAKNKEETTRPTTLDNHVRL